MSTEPDDDRPVPRVATYRRTRSTNAPASREQQAAACWDIADAKGLKVVSIDGVDLDVSAEDVPRD